MEQTVLEGKPPEKRSNLCMSRVLAPGCLKAQAIITELIPALLKHRGLSPMVRG